MIGQPQRDEEGVRHRPRAEDRRQHDVAQKTRDARKQREAADGGELPDHAGVTGVPCPDPEPESPSTASHRTACKPAPALIERDRQTRVDQLFVLNEGRVILRLLVDVGLHAHQPRRTFEKVRCAAAPKSPSRRSFWDHPRWSRYCSQRRRGSSAPESDRQPPAATRFRARSRSGKRHDAVQQAHPIRIPGQTGR